MKNLIAGNWKMNPQTLAEAKKLFEGVKRGIKGIKKTEVVLCPPFVYLSLLKGQASGAQNVFCEEKGAFTGEVSPLMLKNLKVKYVILGHSERRKYFNETGEAINKKIKKALAAGIKIIFCVGETTEERSAGQKSDVLEEQIREGLKGISKNGVRGINIAYEPVWAIGTGNNCSTEETMSSILCIRKVAANLYNRKTADGMRILYGGSVNSQNAGPYIKEAGANGLLVGGASLDAEEFIKIIKSSE